MTNPTSAESQVRFLANIQRILDEGVFVATYKFALLMAVADLSVELGDESGMPLALTTRQIARKFVDYYWRQARPYVSSEGPAEVLRQNTGRQAAVVRYVAEAQQYYVARPDPGDLPQKSYEKLLRQVARNIEAMPLWRLQELAGGVEPFLYRNTGRGSEITLEPGIAFCFRRFHGLVRNLVQGAWLRFVRKVGGNASILGDSTDLAEFLFGSERASLAEYVPILRDVQRGVCFYCRRPIRAGAEVDHFIPWSRYPTDLGHNFVLTHRGCNGKKRELLAALPHLERWRRRNDDHGEELAQRFDERKLVHSLDGSHEVARWAYQQAENVGASVWNQERRGRPRSIRLGEGCSCPDQ